MYIASVIDEGNKEYTTSVDSSINRRSLIPRARFKGGNIEGEGCDSGIMDNISPIIENIRFNSSYLISIFCLAVSIRITIPKPSPTPQLNSELAMIPTLKNLRSSKSSTYVVQSINGDGFCT
ncbi:unnamed protein product [Macrosiphum euphorbiae]|uniref:Uncharacterized protein n=1 Tax=Macrosiphum euphorbiae TaxID=13131 RepID=A0AAV0YC36_9HEMI|nr:unnamed protein product [Macrosiphum euphorbiae]